MQRELTICNKLGLHMRAASKLVQLAEGFDLEVVLHYQGQSADAKSLLEVLQLAGTNGTPITIEAKGDAADEEAEALELVSQLFLNRFDEPE
ncbi:MAG: HPr family phosphocarrier protein [bacterium]|nr:HPr family phosphocarrier protein [bacterium]